MKSQLDNISKNGHINHTPLLPFYFKQIGVGIILVAFLPAIVVKGMSLGLNNGDRELLKYLSLNFLIFGMLVIGFSKDKLEDELTMALRLRSIVFAFVLAATGVILQPVSDWFFGFPFVDIDGQDVVFAMLLVYLTIYYLQKKGR
jgi:hypothetical protein